MDLKKYNQKRDFKKTKEPYGRVESHTKKLRFVVQHHLARRDHYDFRLEWKGTLKSWAIPKGPSYNTADKRLAVRVEDHPFDYRNFEGTIPQGQYGGGTVMIWDEGYWEPTEELDSNLNKSFKFILKGKRLKGEWTLIPMKEDNWLLIKEKDGLNKDTAGINRYKTSIRTGRTMKEIENGVVEKKKVSASKKTSITISNPDKIFFENPKITKKDIADYYEQVAPRMIPFLKNRIISTIQCPDGIKGSCFFKKHLGDKKGLGKIELDSDNDKNDYYYIKNPIGIISEVQTNTVEFHIWGSKIKTLEKPDYLVFDLDPDDKLNLDHVRRGVKDLKSLLDQLSLKSFLKTSGGKGYHVVVPIKPSVNWEQFREFAKRIAEIMAHKWPDRYVSNVRKINRKNKIFVDWIRNTRSSTSVAPYSLRMKNKATVSMPISWRELDTINPDGITISDALKRLRKKDPWIDFFKTNQKLK